MGGHFKRARCGEHDIGESDIIAVMKRNERLSGEERETVHVNNKTI